MAAKITDLQTKIAREKKEPLDQSSNNPDEDQNLVVAVERVLQDNRTQKTHNARFGDKIATLRIALNKKTNFREFISQILESESRSTQQFTTATSFTRSNDRITILLYFLYNSPRKHFAWIPILRYVKLNYERTQHA